MGGNVLTRSGLIVRYAGFAALATVANLATQRVVLVVVAGEFALLLAIMAGTVCGLAIKYVLDRRWIFVDCPPASGSQFARYSATGIVTTALFWACEMAFWLISGNHILREIGAVLGLTVGYWVKYRLDRRFVFATAQESRA